MAGGVFVTGVDSTTFAQFSLVRWGAYDTSTVSGLKSIMEASSQSVSLALTAMMVIYVRRERLARIYSKSPRVVRII